MEFIKIRTKLYKKTIPKNILFIFVLFIFPLMDSRKKINKIKGINIILDKFPIIAKDKVYKQNSNPIEYFTSLFQ